MGFRDMLMFLHHYDFPSSDGPDYIFNGDWVDRGKHQLETISLVFALKAAFPGKVWLNRGNHEDERQNRHMGNIGFEQACLRRFGAARGAEVFGAFVEAYTYLPLGTVISDRIFVVHGGVGEGNWSLEDLDAVERPCCAETITANPMLYNVLWSDPVEDEERNAFGVHSSPRDNHANMVKSFGKDVTEAFCERNDLAMIIRSHEADVEGHGYEVMHDEHLIRVFSARDYADGRERNDGSILFIRKSQGSFLVSPQMLQSLMKRR